MGEFLNNFWGHSHIVDPTKYSFTWRHLIIFFAVLFFIIFFTMLFCRKEQRTQKVFLLVTAFSLLALEIVRMVWNQQYLKANGEELTFWAITEMDLFRLTMWFSVITIPIAVFMGKEKKFSQFLLNFVFSVSAIVAIIDLIAPTFLDNSGYYIYHFINLEYIISRATIILIAMYIGTTEWLDNSIDDMWMAILSLIFVVGLGTIIYFASNQAVDVIYVGGCPWIEMTGITVSSPWHLIIVALFFFGAQVMMYLPFDIHRKIKEKRSK